MKSCYEIPKDVLNLTINSRDRQKVKLILLYPLVVVWWKKIAPVCWDLRNVDFTHGIAQLVQANKIGHHW